MYGKKNGKILRKMSLILSSPPTSMENYQSPTGNLEDERR